MANPAAGVALSSFDAALQADYRLVEEARLQTPALAIYADVVRHNIAATVAWMGGPDRWRPHLKTAKLAAVNRLLVEAGVASAKCATTLELLTACESGMTDVIVAYPAVGPRARRIADIAAQHPHVRVSSLVERFDQARGWKGTSVGVFIDLDPGMHRTGLSDEAGESVLRLATAILDLGVPLRGLHYYDGHIGSTAPADAERVAYAGYARLLALVERLDRAGIGIEEVVTAGTPALPYTLSFSGFAEAPFIHRASPGTIVYNDATSLAQLPGSIGLRPAALVVSTVVSQPTATRVTCDAGHKSVSADAGVPTCAVLGRPDLAPLGPSEEHLPIDVSRATGGVPVIGDILYLVPRHVCPTVNNFDVALWVEQGRIARVEPVTARGREAPILIPPPA